MLILWINGIVNGQRIVVARGLWPPLRQGFLRGRKGDPGKGALAAEVKGLR
jgi:hypothetical protein